MTIEELLAHYPQAISCCPERHMVDDSDNLAQMRAALEEIREKAATIENGGVWAAGLACLCLATLK